MFQAEGFTLSAASPGAVELAVVVVGKKGCPLQIQKCSTYVASLVLIAAQGRIEELCTSPYLPLLLHLWGRI